MKDLIISLEKSLHKKHNRTKKSFLKRILHQDFQELTTFGETWDKEKTIEKLEQENNFEVTIKSTEFNYSQLSSILYQLTYKTEINYQGQVYHSLRTSIWIRNGNEFQLLHHKAIKVL